jgi:hypothetical protein
MSKQSAGHGVLIRNAALTGKEIGEGEGSTAMRDYDGYLYLN